MLSIIIPANNEEAYIAACLEGLLAQTLTAARAGGVEVLVAATGCTDRTVAVAESLAPRFAAKGWELVVLDIPEGGKSNALNRTDATARGGMRAYLDADVICSPGLLEKIHAALDTDAARYASGRLQVAPSRNWVTRHFARLWAELPFMKTGVPGAGIFAVNAAGRARWDTFPKIISDDGYVRLLFSPEERILADAPYSWPMVDGFGQLVRVRRRQDAGMAEIAEKFPEILGNDPKPPITPADYLRLFLGQPVSFLVYISVMLTVRFGPNQTAGGTRGR